MADDDSRTIIKTPTGLWILIPGLVMAAFLALIMSGENDVRRLLVVGFSLLPWIAWASCVIQSEYRLSINKLLLGAVIAALATACLLNRFSFFASVDMTAAMAGAAQIASLMAFSITGTIDLCLSVDSRSSS